MRTIFVLNRQDLAALRSGEPFETRLSDGISITLQAENRKRQPLTREMPKAKPVKRRKFSRAFKRKVAKAARASNPGQAARKFGISRSMVARWAEALAA